MSYFIGHNQLAITTEVCYQSFIQTHPDKLAEVAGAAESA